MCQSTFLSRDNVTPLLQGIIWIILAKAIVLGLLDQSPSSGSISAQKDESNCNFLVQILDGPDSFRQNYEPVLDHFYYFDANSKCKHWVFFRNNDFPFTDYISLIVPYFPHTLCRALTIDLTHCMSLWLPPPPFMERKSKNYLL